MWQETCWPLPTIFPFPFISKAKTFLRSLFSIHTYMPAGLYKANKLWDRVRFYQSLLGAAVAETYWTCRPSPFSVRLGCQKNRSTVSQRHYWLIAQPMTTPDPSQHDSQWLVWLHKFQATQGHQKLTWADRHCNRHPPRGRFGPLFLIFCSALGVFCAV